VEIFRPGTIIRFDRTTSGWQSSIAAGGFVNSAMSVDYFTPSYPALWLDERILPGGPAEIGRAWEVPLSSIGVLLPSLRFKSVNGSIRGRVVGADPSPAAGWAEVEYQYQLRGPMSVGSESEESMRKIGQELQLTGDFDGTLTMRLELAAGYVSRAGLVQRGMIESSLVNSAASAPKRGSSLVGTVLAPAAPPVVAQTTLRSRADTQIVARPAGEEGGTFALAAAPSGGVSAFAAI
jgi:hypothetical protein